MMKRGDILALGAVVGGAALVYLAAAATPDAVESWDSGSVEGWVGTDPLNAYDVSLSNPGDRLEVSFAKKTRPVPEVRIIRATAAASAGDFSGDYWWGAAITNISFSLYCETHVPAVLQVYVANTNTDNWWFYPLETPVAGGWTQYQVPLDYAAGWQLGVGGDAGQFKDDLANVAWIGVELQRNVSTSKQVYAVDNFAVNGASKLADSDEDGMDDWAEFIAGTNPNDADSLFLADVLSTNTPDGFVLQWKSAGNRVYGVHSTTNLLLDFEKVATGIPATPPLNTWVDEAATGQVPYFYKIEVEQ